MPFPVCSTTTAPRKKRLHKKAIGVVGNVSGVSPLPQFGAGRGRFGKTGKRAGRKRFGGILPVKQHSHTATDNRVLAWHIDWMVQVPGNCKTKSFTNEKTFFLSIAPAGNGL